MSINTKRRQFLAYGASAIALGSIGQTSIAGEWGLRRRKRPKGLKLDISCNANSIRFVGPQGPNPNDPADLGPHPYYGASFVVLGTIYRGGFFALNGETSGLNPDGSPEFPDLVTGTWICRGWFIGDSDNDGSITSLDDDSKGGIFTPTGKFVATTQIYDLDPDNPGEKTLVSDGTELIDLNTPFRRAVTGGTGPFRLVRGEVIQTAVGVNATNLFNFSFAFAIRPPR